MIILVKNLILPPPLFFPNKKNTREKKGVDFVQAFVYYIM